MANAVTIQIRDKSKTAICRETLALCGQYEVTVEDMLGNGYLVLHDRYVMPNVWPYDPDGKWAAPMAEDAKWFGYCTLTSGEGDLDLTMEKLVNKLSKHHPLNAVVPVQFTVYKTGEGVIGTGEMQILVTEPYTTTAQSFVSFKGDTGNPGSAASVTVGTTTTLSPESSATVTNSGTSAEAVLNFGIPKGETGATGPSNTLTIGTVQQGSSAGASITGTSPNQTLNLILPKGDKGDKGDDGDDGLTPTIDASNKHWKIGTVDTGVTAEGKDGTDGEDGYSPSVAISSITGGHRVTITDKNHQTTGQTFDVNDGADGAAGVPASVVQVLNPSTGKWHYMYARQNSDGSYVLSMDQTESNRDVGYIVPQGGSANQALIKNSSADYDVKWGSVVVEFDDQPVEGSTKAVKSGGIMTFVNSSISTNTANYISDSGQPFQSLAALQAYSGTVTNNDYAFVVGTDSAGNTTYTRYKYSTATTPAAWCAEYVLNNSSFTAAQWAAISSGIVAADKTKLDGITAAKISGWDTAASNSHTHANKSVLDGIDSTDISNWDGKQDELPTTGTASATYAINVSGNAATATTATTATSATNDADGNAISSTYAKKATDLGGYKIAVVSSSSSATSSDTIYFITES